MRHARFRHDSPTSQPACREPTRQGAASSDRCSDSLHSCFVALWRPELKPAGPISCLLLQLPLDSSIHTPSVLPPVSPQHRHTEWLLPLHTRNCRTETNDPAFPLLSPSPLHILTPALRNQRCCAVAGCGLYDSCGFELRVVGGDHNHHVGWPTQGHGWKLR